ncbi:uncharacterized protein BO87DRAFT_146244 [Aspergillus neoniger CBS 115656]|uniref:Uncharacterized protein n=1 Tax=Aspergillus neoniger (strain CBS 115656) TaxID=1448310 RepID=A0A318YA32_ASPNB|nr:hypothetical protein BO87DRAFT_146244 [Aspergillus neoniger CBS 115656]PYH30839.1 hypothetical protein BO87DRAFT_146244 [Aspergillus neoniger CBS 115656]
MAQGCQVIILLPSAFSSLWFSSVPRPDVSPFVHDLGWEGKEWSSGYIQPAQGAADCQVSIIDVLC